MRSAVTATALGITLTIAGLAGCTGPRPPGLSPGPEPSGTPVFASEEEALAAAEELYGEYLAYSNSLGQSGWVDPKGFDAYLSGEALEDEVEGAEALAAKGYVQLGDASYDTVSLQQVDDGGNGSLQIVIYLCSDVTSVDVLDSNGLSVVSEDRPDRQPLEIEMDDRDGALKIVRSEAWSGADFC